MRTITKMLLSAFIVLASPAIADETDVPERPFGIYGGNINSERGKARVANWERWLEIQAQAKDCIANLENAFKPFLAEMSELSWKGRSISICTIKDIKTDFLILELPSNHNLDTIDGVFSERRNGWGNRFARGETNISLKYTLTPIRPNFWSLTMTNHIGTPEFEGEELYVWAKDYSSLAWFGRRLHDVDGVENVQLISCTRLGCRSLYRMPLCRDQVKANDIRLMVKTVDDSSEDLFLENFSHLHSLSEIFRQKFLEYSCR